MQGTTTQKTDFTNPDKRREIMDERALDRVSKYILFKINGVLFLT